MGKGTERAILTDARKGLRIKQPSLHKRYWMGEAEALIRKCIQLALKRTSCSPQALPGTNFSSHQGTDHSIEPSGARQFRGGYSGHESDYRASGGRHHWPSGREYANGNDGHHTESS